MAELTPIAIASVNTATIVNPGVLRSCRTANLKSWIMTIVPLFPLRCRLHGLWIQQLRGVRNIFALTTGVVAR